MLQLQRRIKYSKACPLLCVGNVQCYSYRGVLNTVKPVHYCVLGMCNVTVTEAYEIQ